MSADRLADVHTQFAERRDKLYQSIAACDFAGAGKLCGELRRIFSRYCEVREEMARGARAEFATNTRWARSKSRAHLAAVAAKDRTDQLDELLTREAIAALDKEQEQEGDE